MPKRRTRVENDAIILSMLADGSLTVDPSEGLVHVGGGRMPYRRLTKDGYWQMTVRGYRFMEHRVIYLAAHGAIGDLDINHRNGQRADNRIANLEAVSKSQNNYHRTRNCQYLGTFPDEDVAVADDFRQSALALAARGNVTRDEVRALLGRTDVEDEAPELGVDRYYNRGPGHKIIA